MFEFFRRFQRLIFSVATVILVIFFAFFGVSSVFVPEERVAEDRVVVHAIDGSPLMLSQVRGLARFLGTDQEDFYQGAKGGNLCNDGVMRYDLQESGIAKLLAYSFLEKEKVHPAEYEERLLHLSAQFILNGAKLAYQKGFRVTLEEAKGDLLWNFQSALQKRGRRSLLASMTCQEYLRSLGFDEWSAAEIWQNVLLFRRYFQGVSGAAFVDRLPYQEFASYACEAAKIQIYQWPFSVGCQDEQQWMELQAYLDAVGGKSHGGNPCVLEPLAVEEIALKHPELAVMEFHSKASKVSLQQAALCAGLKEVWSWASDEGHWVQLKEKFPFLGEAKDSEARFDRYNRLSDQERLQVDSWIRLRLLDLHPEWLEQAWAKAVPSDTVIHLSHAWASLAGISQPERLRDLFIRAAEGEKEAQEYLFSYTEDGKIARRFTEIAFLSKERILTFEEAKKKKISTALLEKELQESHSQIRVRYPKKFQNASGEWKPYAEVKKELLHIACQDKLARFAKQRGECLQTSPEISFFIDSLSKDALSVLQSNPMHENWVIGNGGFSDQFKLIMVEQKVLRADESHWAHAEAFGMETGEWSSLHHLAQGGFAFFSLVGKERAPNSVSDRVHLANKELAGDAQRYLAVKLLELIQEKKAIAIWKEGL